MPGVAAMSHNTQHHVLIPEGCAIEVDVRLRAGPEIAWRQCIGHAILSIVVVKCGSVSVAPSAISWTEFFKPLFRADLQ